MDVYVYQYGRKASSNQVLKAMKQNVMLSERVIVLINKQYAMSFWLHLAKSLHEMNQKVIYPLALFTLLLEFRGLSRIGKSICNYAGLSPTVRTIDKVKESLLVAQKKEISELIESEIFMIAADNYTHIYGSPSITTSRDTQYHNPMYSVVALVKIPIQVPANLIPLTGVTYASSVPSSIADLRVFEQDVSFVSLSGFVLFFFYYDIN
jgi:hypothetical protein